MAEDFLISEQKFVDKFGQNKYQLVNVAAYRARQINDGVEVYVKSRTKHPLQVALLEISEGFIDYTLGADKDEITDSEESGFRFDDIVDLEGDFSLDDEDAFDIEDIDFDDDFMTTED